MIEFNMKLKGKQNLPGCLRQEKVHGSNINLKNLLDTSVTVTVTVTNNCLHLGFSVAFWSIHYHYCQTFPIPGWRLE